MNTFLILAVLFATVWIYSLFSVLLNDFKNNVNKIVWILLLIFLPFTAFLYPIIGRMQIKDRIKNEHLLLNQNLNKTNNVAKSKIVAFILTILNSGLGFLYIGQLKKAFIFTLLPPFIFISMLCLSSYITSALFVIFSYIFIVFVYIYAIYSVIQSINKNNITVGRYNRWYSLVLFLVISTLYVYILKTISPVILMSQPSSSMSYTLEAGDSILVDTNKKIISKRGDIVIFRFPLQDTIHYVKRCVAKEGDEVIYAEEGFYFRPIEGDAYIHERYKGVKTRHFFGKLFVYDPYLSEHPGVHYEKKPMNAFAQMLHYASANQLFMSAHRSAEGEIFFYHKVEKDHFFMMGDNRDNSNDSRFFGTVPQYYIVGRPKLIYMNLNDFSRIGKEIK